MGWVSSAAEDGSAGGQATCHFPQRPVPAPEVGGPCLWGSFVDPGQRHTGSALGLRRTGVRGTAVGPPEPLPQPGPEHREGSGSGRCPWSWKDAAAVATSFSI